MLRGALVFGATISWAASAYSQETADCEALSAAMQAVAAGVVPEFDTGPASFAGAHCEPRTTVSGEPWVFCRWQHGYRAPEASAQFDAWRDRLDTCFDASRASDDDAVNHPDSYALHQVRGQGAVLSVSLKDKAALDATFVFLRIEPGP